MEFKLWEKEIPMYDSEIDTPNTMTAYLADVKGKAPAMVVFAGGGYSYRSPHEADDIAKFYQSKGIHAFVVNYRVSPYMFPAALMDAQRAVKIVKKNADKFGVDIDKIFVIGFSAGGHLASCVATMKDMSNIGDEYDEISPRVTGAVLCYPVTSAIPEDGTITDCVAKLTNGTRDERELLTTYKQVTDSTPPCFIWHTSTDGCVPVQHSLNFANALNLHKIPVEMHIFPEGRHGLGLAKDFSDVSKWADLSVEWIFRNFS